MLKVEQLSPKLLTVGFGFLVSTLLFAYTLGRSLSALTLSKEALLGTVPVLLFLFLTASLAAIFALLVERKILVLGMLIAAIFFALPFTSLLLFWRLTVVLILFLGFLFLGSQARGTHEAYTGFSASHFKGVLRNFFLLFVFILGIILFSSTSQALGRSANGGFEIPEETLKPIVAQFVGMVGGMLRQQVGERIPEDQLAPYVEEQLIQLIRQVGFEFELKGKPTSFAQATDRVTKGLKTELDKKVTPFKVYLPFVVAGIAVLTLLSLSPFVGLIGAPFFFIVYRFLILVRVLKFEEVERKVKRLALA